MSEAIRPNGHDSEPAIVCYDTQPNVGVSVLMGGLLYITQVMSGIEPQPPFSGTNVPNHENDADLEAIVFIESCIGI